MHHYEEVVAKLDEIERAVRAAGRSVENTRLARYKRTFEILADPAKRARLTDHFSKDERIQIFATMGELHELARIFDVLGPKYPTILFPKVRDLLSGPDSASYESAAGGRSGHSRNIQFELFMMAEFSGSGFPLDDDSLTDVKSSYAGKTVLVECKRPQRLDSIHGALKDALYQLNKQPRNQIPGALKIAALSLTKALAREVGIVGAPTGRHAGDFLTAWVENAIGPHCHYYHENGGPCFGGILAYASLSAIQANGGNPALIMKQVFFNNPAASTDTVDAAEEWFKAFSATDRPGVNRLP